MHEVEIQIRDAQSTEAEIEDFLTGSPADFKPARRSLAERKDRQSTVGDVMTVIGHVATAASLLKTVLDIYKLARTSGNQSLMVSVKNSKTGQQTEVSEESAERDISKILS